MPTGKQLGDAIAVAIKRKLESGAVKSIHDRDINAARNVLAAGLAASVCGENVSPVLL